MEQWRPVVGWEGLYEVSDQGQVRSLPRVIKRANGIPQTISARLLKTPTASHGYPRLNLSRNGALTQVTVHRIVLEAFVGPCPTGMETLHRNGIKTDCRLENLRWGTSSQNKEDILRHGTHGMIRRTHCAKGHPYDESNTYWYRGRRLCRACRRQVRIRLRALARG